MVLPEPLLPSRPKISPFSMLKDKSLMTTLSAKDILKCLTSMNAVLFFCILEIFYHFRGEFGSGEKGLSLCLAR